MTHFARWVRFSAVGLLGFALQTVVLSLLVRRAGLSTHLAVTAAVLVTVSHNFLWHEYFTWPDVPRAGRVTRWVAFNASTGFFSVVTNVWMTALVMAATGLAVVAANAIAVAIVSMANFWLSDRVLFREQPVAEPLGGVAASSSIRLDVE